MRRWQSWLVKISNRSGPRGKYFQRFAGELIPNKVADVISEWATLKAWKEDVQQAGYLKFQSKILQSYCFYLKNCANFAA